MTLRDEIAKIIIKDWRDANNITEIAYEEADEILKAVYKEIYDYVCACDTNINYITLSELQKLFERTEK